MKNQQVINNIKALKMISPRSAWITLNRDFLMRQIIADRAVAPVRLSWRDLIQATFGLASQQVFQPAVAMLLLLAVSLGSSLVVNAAFYSLPGDSLYQVKIALEKTQLAVTSSDEQQAELKVAFAQNRVKEFNKIVAQTDVAPSVRTERLNLAVAEFRKNVASVQDHISKIAKSSSQLDEKAKANTLRIALNISSETQELAKSLGDKTSSLPAGEKAEVEAIVAQAVESVQQTSLSAQELIAGSNSQPQPATSTEALTTSQPVTDDSQSLQDTETSTSAFSEPLITGPKSADDAVVK